MNKVIVTGGAGFIGSHLVERLLESDNEVTVLDNCATGRLANLKSFESHPHLRVHQVDISHFEAIKNLFLDKEEVYHLAALADIVPSIQRPLDYFHCNVDSTANVMESCRLAGVKRVLYVASSTCYGIPDKYPTPETAPVRPQYPYALTKYLGEEVALHWGQVYGAPRARFAEASARRASPRYLYDPPQSVGGSLPVRQAGVLRREHSQGDISPKSAKDLWRTKADKMGVNSVRLFNVYGPRSRTSGTYGAVFGIFLAQKLHGKPFTVVGDGTQTRDFTYVTDAVEAMEAVMKSGLRNEVLNVGSGLSVSVNRIVEILGGEKVFIPKRPGEPDCTFADISKIQHLLKWRPKVSIEEGIKRLLGHIDYWKEAPVWTPASIAEATRDWFHYLGK